MSKTKEDTKVKETEKQETTNVLTQEEVLAEKDKELEALKAQLAEKEAAIKAMEGKPAVTVQKKEEKETVEVTLFYDGNQYKDPMFVSVNGESLLIPRGKPVKIPKHFKEVVDRSIAQEQKTSAFYQRLEESTAANLNGTGQTLVDVKP
ncbi:MAG: hypothetical protein GX786_00600 [Clostridiales bacterium]|nr:hypothetical protein [Clostridiales bacterium]